MANTFKNYTSASVGTGATTTYTVPSATTSVMIGCNLANRTASSIKVDVQAAGVYVIKDAPIPSGSALSVLDGKIILETTDTVVVTSDTASSCDVIVSVLEQT
jgi:biopolymer transport protein ExbD